MKYYRSKLEATTGSLLEAQTKTAKKDYFTKNLPLPTFFEINTLNFQEMFLDIFLMSEGFLLFKFIEKTNKKNS